jgi:cytochrome c
MNRSALAVALAAVAFSGAALASPELAAKHFCMSCHNMDAKGVGPSFKDVAAKYAGNAKAADMLAEKTVKGGGGVWGPVPMPANAKIPRDDAQKLAAWVLTQR